MQATQEKNRVTNEINELKDHVDIKDRKINVLQRKVYKESLYFIDYAFILMSSTILSF